MSTILALQQWYSSQCDGDWEHEFGVQIGTLDNPGWRVQIDLVGTPLEGKPFDEISNLEADNDWIRCWVADGKFQAAGGPAMLEEIICQFLTWASHE